MQLVGQNEILGAPQDLFEVVRSTDCPSRLLSGHNQGQVAHSVGPLEAY